MPIVKHSWLVQDAREIPEVMRAAFHVARSGRCGPVLVDVPRDLQEALIDFSYPETVDLPGWKPPSKVHPLQIREAARAIANARKPVLYVGGGTLNGDACAELLQLAEGGTLPVITTLMGKSAFPEDHELHFGWPGMHGPKWSNLAMNTCDVLVAIGARFDDRVTGKLSAFAAGATVVHLDIDPAEISKLRDADIPVVGPLAKAVGELANEVARHRADGAPAPHAWLEQIRAWRDEFPLRYGSGGDWLKPQRVVETLQALTAGDDVIVTTGVGQHQMWAMQYVQSIRPRSFITSGGLGTMGYGIPAAIGAKAARPEATVVCIDGDGCFQMTAQELTTAVLDDLPIVVVLVNNGYLGMVTQWQDMFFDGRRSHVHLTSQVPDYAKLAEAYGGVGMVVENDAELEPALVRGAVDRPHRGRRLPRRPGRALLPDDPRGRGRPRHDRVHRDGRGGEGVVKHTLSVIVEDRPGALTRITTMFARRGFNIESLAVGPTERAGVSCITLRVDCTQHTLEQIEKQIHKLVNVLRVTELVSGEAVERELLVARVSAPPERRAELVTTAEALGGRLLDVGPDAVVLELTGTPEEVDAFHELCRPYGVVDLVRTGRVGVPLASARRKAPRRLAAIN